MATTKKDLIDRIAEHTGDTQILVKSVVQRFFQDITAELAQGNRLEFGDFGVLERKTTPARVARISRIMERAEVPAKYRVVFGMGRRMTERLDGNQREPPAKHPRHD